MSNGIGLAMPTGSTRAPGSLPQASDGRRLHIHGIKEMPAGYDAEVAELFRDLRAASNLSEIDLAATLATRPEVVQALEQGALYALPPWPETSRVVNSYGLLLNLDVRPLLQRIYAQIEPSPSVQAQDPYAAGRTPEPQAPPARSPLDIPFETEQRVAQPQPYQEPARAPQQNWAPPPVDRRMQPRAPGAPMPGRPMPPQQQPPRPPQPNAPQARPPQALQPQAPQPRPAQPQPQPQMRAPQAPPPRPQPTPQPSPVGAAMAPQSAAKPVPEKKAWLGKYLKWGVAALVLIAAAYGLYFVLSSGSGLLGTSSPSQSGEKAGKPTDPDDPRSHKSDRLPSPSL